MVAKTGASSSEGVSKMQSALGERPMVAPDASITEIKLKDFRPEPTVKLPEHHPDRFAEAVDYEKTALRDGSPFTWSQGESLTELIAPERVAQIKSDYEKRRERLRQRRRVNPLSANQGESVDDIYGVDEASGGCVICHK